VDLSESPEETPAVSATWPHTPTNDLDNSNYFTPFFYFFIN
jgi:hypothetical protein